MNNLQTLSENNECPQIGEPVIVINPPVEDENPKIEKSESFEVVEQNENVQNEENQDEPLRAQRSNTVISGTILILNLIRMISKFSARRRERFDTGQTVIDAEDFQAAAEDDDPNLTFGDNEVDFFICPCMN